MTPLSPGMPLWLSLMVVALIGPPLFYAWRRRAFRCSIRAIMISFLPVAIIAIWLKHDVTHFTEIMNQPNAALGLIWVEAALVVSWVICLLVDGLSILMKRRRS